MPTIDSLTERAAPITPDMPVAEVFDLFFEELPAEDSAGLWPQPIHEQLKAKPTGATRAGATQGVEQVPVR